MGIEARIEPISRNRVSPNMSFENDRDRGAHLLRRFGLGASEAELDYYLRDGLRGAVDLLLEPVVADGFELDPQRLENDKGQLVVPLAVIWWVARMAVTRHPLREKMTLFWHDHFATSASKVNSAPVMLQQNEVLRDNAIGPFRQLLARVSKDPAMLYWLDNQENVKGKPNENFAREVMELFTLGFNQGYTESDVAEAARAFTGWSIRRPGKNEKPITGPDAKIKRGAEFLFRPFLHDDGTKTVLGKTGNLSGEDVLNLLCDQPRAATYLTTKIWEWFVYPHPEPAVLEPFVRQFRESDLDIKVLLRAIMTSKEFYSARAGRAIVKNPVDFCISTLRQLGVGQQLREAMAKDDGERINRIVLLPAAVAQNGMKGMGMSLMYPPDVAGWESGAGWISTATMVERIEWADRIFGTQTGSVKNGKPALRYPADGLFEKDPSPTGIVGTLVSVFDAPVKPERRAMLVKAAQSELGKGSSLSQVATVVSRLIFATPEFQFA